MRGEILLARLQQALGLTREMLLEEHRCQHKHIGFALVLGDRRDLPSDSRTPGEQSGFKVSCRHLSLRR